MGLMLRAIKILRFFHQGQFPTENFNAGSVMLDYSWNDETKPE